MWNKKLTILASLVIGWATSLLYGSDWPEFRGPTGQGHSESKNLPIEWSPTENVSWKTAIPGVGWSSPVIQGNAVFLTTAAGNQAGPSLQVIRLDAASGNIVFAKEIFRQSPSGPRIHQKNSHASPTPIIEGDRLYVHFGHQGTACLDLDGNILWKRVINYNPLHGNGGSPVIAGNNLVFNCDGTDNPFIIALNKVTGEIAWRVPRRTDASSKFSFATPLVIEVNGQPQIISPGSNVVSGLDPRTGEEIWRVRYEGYSVITRPVYAHGLIFFSTSFDRPVLLAIRPDGKGDVTRTHVAWSGRRSVPNTPSMLVAGDELYMISDSGIATCMDARTGQIHWNERVAGPASASPMYADGRIYFQDEQGKGVVVQAGKDFRILAENSLDERTLASYAVADDALFIRTAQYLYRIADQ